MASDSTFDVVSKVDMAEVKNAINQVMMEIRQRYDFKGSKSEVGLDEKNSKITLTAENDMKRKSVVDIMQSKCAKRNIPIKNFQYGAVDNASGGMVRQEVIIQQGIPSEKAKDIVKMVKGLKLKVQASINDNLVRVSGKKKDDLQSVMASLKEKDFGVSLQFVNFR